MTHLIDDITHTSRKYENKLKKSFLPMEQLGLTYFAIQRVFNDGHWNILSTNPTWIEYSAGNQLYLYDPSLIDPTHYQSGIFYVDSHDNDDFRNIFCKHAEGIFDLGNSLAIINRKEEYCEFAFFSTTVSNKKIINTYLNKITDLRNFITHFKSQHEHMFHLAHEHNVDLKQFNKSYFNNDNVIDVTPTDDKQYLFQNNVLFNILSAREKECINHFLNGKTAKETAALLGLSYRTVEDYFANIKKKLNCRNKRELFYLFRT